MVAGGLGQATGCNTCPATRAVGPVAEAAELLCSCLTLQPFDKRTSTHARPVQPPAPTTPYATISTASVRDWAAAELQACRVSRFKTAGMLCCCCRPLATPAPAGAAGVLGLWQWKLAPYSFSLLQLLQRKCKWEVIMKQTLLRSLGGKNGPNLYKQSRA